MFDNVGGKLKALAKVECWLGIGLFVLLGLSEMVSSFFGGLLTIALGTLGSWLGSLLTYGVGEAVELAQTNNKLLNQMKNDQKLEVSNVGNGGSSAVNRKTPVNGSTGWVCRHCGVRNSSIAMVCKNCGNVQ